MLAWKTSNYVAPCLESEACNATARSQRSLIVNRKLSAYYPASLPGWLHSVLIVLLETRCPVVTSSISRDLLDNIGFTLTVWPQPDLSCVLKLRGRLRLPPPTSHLLCLQNQCLEEDTTRFCFQLMMEPDTLNHK